MVRIAEGILRGLLVSERVLVEVMQQERSTYTHADCAADDQKHNRRMVRLRDRGQVGRFRWRKSFASHDFDAADEVGFGDGEPAGQGLVAAGKRNGRVDGPERDVWFSGRR
jgi:hypothetical protein